MKSILLIEDDPFLSNIYVIKLEEAGFNVNALLSGKEALKEIEEKRPDLILLDIVLPDISGWEILEQIKKNPEIKSKIMILSNLGQKEDKEKGLKMGADYYLIKAYYTPTELVEEIKKII
ncbi:MAG: response regulator [Candidatus Pacebacteria bacterium]|nr:response regulator [Candidatus Paceibacterota bacterium]